MAWTYSQSSGLLRSPLGEAIGLGYSGHAAGVNNPALQEVKDVGPIPQGRWTIGAASDLPHFGPLVMVLTPDALTDTFSRDGFMIHGDNAAMDHSASCGCIILSHEMRATIAKSTDRALVVTP